MPILLPVNFINQGAFRRNFSLKVCSFGKTIQECWLWLAGTRGKSNKRPIIIIDNTIYYASRIAYYLEYGIDPENLHVLHDCDNLLCCNPNHLFLGTHQENMTDAAIKGRKAVKLNKEQIIEIRKLYRTGNYTQLQLGNMYDVSREMIRDIYLFKRWLHIKG